MEQSLAWVSAFGLPQLVSNDPTPFSHSSTDCSMTFRSIYSPCGQWLAAIRHERRWQTGRGSHHSTCQCGKSTLDEPHQRNISFWKLGRRQTYWWIHQAIFL